VVVFIEPGQGGKTGLCIITSHCTSYFVPVYNFHFSIHFSATLKKKGTRDTNRVNKVIKIRHGVLGRASNTVINIMTKSNLGFPMS
jgi:hypothetical protein